MILFLDFDGVLHPDIATDAPDFCCLPHLWSILRAQPAAEVVFSTSWREIYTQDELLAFVTLNGGEDLPARFIGSTPVLIQEPGAYISGPVYKREAECCAWLRGNGIRDRRWLALDDVDFWFPANCQNLYMVDHRTGLTDADVPRIIERLS